MGATNIQVVTGSDSFVLINPSSRSRRRPKTPGSEKQINIPNPSGKEFRLTITISFNEYRQPSQESGSLWLEYLIGATTASLPGPFEAVVPIENPDPKNNYFLLVTRGNVRIHYTGQGRMHVALSYYAEIPEIPS